MVEQISAELAADAEAFAAALPASVEMPAGAGKTHLLAATAKHVVDSGGRVLVLTHTNAGVYAIKARLKRFGITKGAQVATVTAFAFRLARSYPQLGGVAAPKIMIPADSTLYIEAATRIAESKHIGAVLAASFTHLLVDEYQDCNEQQHAFVSAIRGSVPATGVLGDPLQAIFGFADRLVDWSVVTAEYPLHHTTVVPHRWTGHNPDLGEWLLAIRPHMIPGHRVEWTTVALPSGVTFTNTAANPQGIAQAAFSDYPAGETVLIIAGWPATARTIAGNLNGTYTVMEEVAGKFMAQSLQGLVSAEPAAYALWLFDLTKKCYCGHGVLDTGTLRTRYLNGRTASDLLDGGSGSRAGAELAIGAFDVLVSNPTLGNLAAAMDVIPASSALRLHSHEAWYDIQVSIRGAVARGDDSALLHEELAKARDVLRFAGRRERRRLISRTLLVKGLEYDHVIIAEVGEHAEVNDLYVALSRARKSIRILGRANTLLLRESPRGS